jgi:hypothetical protein
LKRYTTQRRLTALAAAACAASALGGAAARASNGADPARVGEWRFDESGGQSAIDLGPFGLHGHLGASELEDAADPERISGAAGGALRFNGASFVRLPHRSELNVQSLTAETVARSSSSPGPWRYLVSRGGRGCFAGSYGLYTGAAGGIAVYVFDGSRYTVSATARPVDVWDGRWHHIAGTFDGRYLRLFVDGRPVGDPIYSPMSIDYATTSAGTYLGRFVTCELAFTGDLDFVRLWSGALSAGAVSTTAAAELSVTPLPGSGAPLPAAAPPTTIAASPDGAAPGPRPETTCVLRLARKRVAASRQTKVRVRVELHGRPAHARRVVAKRLGSAAVIAAARTGRKGWARLVFDARRLERVRISAPRTSPCAPVEVRVSV